MAGARCWRRPWALSYVRTAAMDMVAGHSALAPAAGLLNGGAPGRMGVDAGRLYSKQRTITPKGHEMIGDVQAKPRPAWKARRGKKQEETSTVLRVELQSAWAQASEQEVMQAIDAAQAVQLAEALAAQPATRLLSSAVAGERLAGWATALWRRNWDAAHRALGALDSLSDRLKQSPPGPGGRPEPSGGWHPWNHDRQQQQAALEEHVPRLLQAMAQGEAALPQLLRLLGPRQLQRVRREHAELAAAGKRAAGAEVTLTAVRHIFNHQLPLASMQLLDPAAEAQAAEALLRQGAGQARQQPQPQHAQQAQAAAAAAPPPLQGAQQLQAAGQPAAAEGQPAAAEAPDGGEPGVDGAPKAAWHISIVGVEAEVTPRWLPAAEGQGPGEAAAASSGPGPKGAGTGAAAGSGDQRRGGPAGGSSTDARGDVAAAAASRAGTTAGSEPEPCLGTSPASAAAHEPRQPALQYRGVWVVGWPGVVQAEQPSASGQLAGSAGSAGVGAASGSGAADDGAADKASPAWMGLLPGPSHAGAGGWRLLLSLDGAGPASVAYLAPLLAEPDQPTDPAWAAMLACVARSTSTRSSRLVATAAFVSTAAFVGWVLAVWTVRCGRHMWEEALDQVDLSG